ncbi:hypothetical protein LAD64_23730 [Klebsiella pneumoniae]|nr:hypothetical protein [Klebsiella pneumoniae]
MSFNRLLYSCQAGIRWSTRRVVLLIFRYARVRQSERVPSFCHLFLERRARSVKTLLRFSGRRSGAVITLFQFGTHRRPASWTADAAFWTARRFHTLPFASAGLFELVFKLVFHVLETPVFWGNLLDTGCYVHMQGQFYSAAERKLTHCQTQTFAANNSFFHNKLLTIPEYRRGTVICVGEAINALSLRSSAYTAIAIPFRQQLPVLQLLNWELFGFVSHRTF